MRSCALAILFVLNILLPMNRGLTAEPDKPKDAIPEATQKGVEFLKAVHRPNPQYNGGSYGMGTACLGGLALLESGVDERQPSLQNIIKFVRRGSMEQTSTYNLSLAIMFLDRLGDPADLPLIQFLAIRLMTGQTESGGWGYECGLTLTPQQDAHLRRLFAKESKLVRADPPSKDEAPPKNPAETSPPKKDTAPALHPEVGKLLNQMQTVGGAGGDNSNTQFATLALWCARKHGVPVEKSMKALEKRFRETQCADGGWDYGGSPENPSSPAMSCAGLIALAVTYGTSENVLRNKNDAPKPAPQKKERVDLGADEAVTSGLKGLGAHLRGPNNGGNAQKNPVLSKIVAQDLYFLWSLERVGVIYGLPTIGKVDWYTGGAEILVRTQRPNGSWNASYQPDVDTAFAVLFLSRANVAKDLASVLDGKVKDPGMSMLRSGDLARILGKSPNDSPKPPAPELSPRPKPETKTETTKPEGDFETQVSRLTEAVVNASAEQRTLLIQRLRDAKGSVNTEALSRIVAKVMGDSQIEVREALARRLTRMTAATLGEMFKDERREIRLAAATACGLKGDKQLAPELIRALEDKDAQIAQAAHASLHSLAGKDFGPAGDATDTDRARSIVAWKNWWKMQQQ